MRPLDNGKNCLVFLFGISMSLGAMSQTPYLNNPSTNSKSATTSKKPVFDNGNGPSSVMRFENPSTKNLEPDFDASTRTSLSTPPERSLAWSVSVNSAFPNHLIDKDGQSPQSLRFEERAFVGAEVTLLSRPFLSRAGIDLRYRAGLGLGVYQRKDAITDSFGVRRADHQSLFLLPVPFEVEASHRFRHGLSPLVSLGVAPTITIGSDSLLQDSKVALGMMYRVAAGVRQEFLGSNSLMLELSMNWNKILTESPNGLGLRVGYQRPF